VTPDSLPQNKMSDEETICSWMEPKPYDFTNDVNWWACRVTCGIYIFTPRQLDLDALHEVEGKLNWRQWRDYEMSLGEVIERSIDPTMRPAGANVKDFIHATVQQKITALAAVLRPERGGSTPADKADKT
jgi:hypothetical protein